MSFRLWMESKITPRLNGEGAIIRWASQVYEQMRMRRPKQGMFARRWGNEDLLPVMSEFGAVPFDSAGPLLNNIMDKMGRDHGAQHFLYLPPRLEMSMPPFAKVVLFLQRADVKGTAALTEPIPVTRDAGQPFGPQHRRLYMLMMPHADSTAQEVVGQLEHELSHLANDETSRPTGRLAEKGVASGASMSSYTLESFTNYVAHPGEIDAEARSVAEQIKSAAGNGQARFDMSLVRRFATRPYAAMLEHLPTWDAMQRMGTVQLQQVVGKHLMNGLMRIDPELAPDAAFRLVERLREAAKRFMSKLYSELGG